MTPLHRRCVKDVIARSLGRSVQVRAICPLGGGDISHVVRVVTDTGSYVVKSHGSPPPGFFAAEAAGLEALRASGAVRCPSVLAVVETPQPAILLEDLGDGQATADADEVFGRSLAALHRHGAPAFGFDSDTFCGLTRQSNLWTGSWVEFYGQHRLEPQARAATDAGALSAADARLLQALIARLDRLIDEPTPGPSLIHGDLWAGNRHIAADGRPAVIDPSCSFSHREAELGMMTLFGGFTARVFAAYDDAFPLEPGWRERNPIYQLYHLLNHLNLFGGGYHAQVMAVVQEFAG